MPETPPIERAFLRDTGDGTTVFFPWGLTHRGYELPDARARRRASRATSLLVGSTIAIGTWTAHLLQPFLESEAAPADILRVLAAPAAALIAVLLGYWGWASRFVEGYTESSLRISREERLREASEAAPPRTVAVIGVVVAGLGAVAIWLQPSAWWLGAAALALGVGLLLWSSVLRSARPCG